MESAVAYVLRPASQGRVSVRWRRAEAGVTDPLAGPASTNRSRPKSTLPRERFPLNAGLEGIDVLVREPIHHVGFPRRARANKDAGKTT